MITLKKILYTTTLSLIILLLSTTFANAQKELWGTGRTNYSNPYGFIYKTDSIGENMQIIHRFDSINAYGGSQTSSSLILASDGNLYGRTAVNGTIYKYDLAEDSFEVKTALGIYTTPGLFPRVNDKLIETQPGILLSTAKSYVYAYNFYTDSLYEVLQTPLYYNTNDITHSPLHANLCNLFKASDGTIYVAQLGGVATCAQFNGGVSKINPITGSYTNLYNNCVGYSGPYSFKSNYIERNGLLYSTAQGGTNLGGVIYSFNPINNTVNTLFSLPSAINGSIPASIIEGSNGLFYGTVYPENNSGSSSCFLFSFDPTLNQFEKLYTFSNSLWNEISFERNGKLYGVTQSGVFEYDIANDTLEITSPVNNFEVFESSKLIEICRKPFFKYSDTTSFNLCEGSHFELDIKCNNADSIIWRKDGVIVPTFQTSEIAYDSITVSQTGTWQAEMINECGSTLSSAIQITVTPTSTSTITSTISADSLIEICPSSSFVLSGNNGGVWSTGATTPTLTVSSPGTYQIVNTNSCGLFYSNKVTVDTIFIPRPVISTNTTSYLCQYNNIVITSTIPGTWNNGDSGTSITIPAEPNVPYYMWSQNQCRTDTSNTISLAPSNFYSYEPIPILTNTAHHYEICTGDSVLLSSNVNSTYNIYLYSWIRFDGTFNNPASGSVTTSNNVPSIYVKQQGTYFLRQQSPCGYFYTDTVYVSVNQPLSAPVIQPIYPLANLCEGNTIKIRTFTTGGIWNTGNATDTLNVQQDGSYYYSVTNACGAVNSNTLTYDFTENNVSFTLPSSSICVAGGDTSIALTGGYPTGGSYGGSGVTSNIFNTSLVNPGANTLTYTKGINFCLFTATATITLDTVTPETPLIYYQINGVGAAVTVQLGEEITLCDNQTVLLVTNPFFGHWNNGDPAIVQFITSPGLYYFTAENSCGMSNSNTLEISTTPAISPSFVNIGPFCSGTNFTLPSVSNESVTGTWSPAVNNLQTTTYTFTPDAGQCASTSSLTVTINNPSVSFELPIVEFCINDNAILMGDVTPSGGVFSGNGVIGDQFDPEIAGVGNHLITYTITDGLGCSSYVTSSVSVFSLPDATVILQATTLTAVSGNSYQWLDCDNGSAAINGAMGVTFTPVQNGNYAVLITSPEGCSDTSACFNVTTAGIESYTKSTYKLYPNPLNNELTIEGEGNINSIDVYSLTGQLLQSVTPQSSMIKINFSTYEQGVYLVEVHTTDGQVTTSRVVKD